VTFFRSASTICLVISGGRSEVHASHARKLMGLCKVQTGHVHPSRYGSGEGGSGAATAAGLGAGVDAAVGGEAKVSDFFGMVLGLFFDCSETKRLTGRSGCCLIGGALVRAGAGAGAGDLASDSCLMA
jgi:hypothetical protein